MICEIHIYVNIFLTDIKMLRMYFSKEIHNYEIKPRALSKIVKLTIHLRLWNLYKSYNLYVHVLYTKSGTDGYTFSVGPDTTVRFVQHILCIFLNQFKRRFYFRKKKTHNLDRSYNFFSCCCCCSNCCMSSLQWNETSDFDQKSLPKRLGKSSK